MDFRVSYFSLDLSNILGLKPTRGQGEGSMVATQHLFQSGKNGLLLIDSLMTAIIHP